MTALPLALAAAAALAASPAGKPFGLLLLVDGVGPEWIETIDAVVKQAGGRYPVEFVAGEADGPAIQRAVDALQAKRVLKIVAVALSVSPFSDIMNQNRFLLGIREKPSMGMPATRLTSKVALVLSKTLDGQDALVEVVADRARALSKQPAADAVVLVAAAPKAIDAARDWTASLDALAEKARARAGFRKGRALTLPLDQTSDQRDKTEKAVRETIKALHKEGGNVVVLPLELSPDYVASRLPHILEGLFARYNGKCLLPDRRIARWVGESAADAAKLPDMRVFKDVPKGVKHASTR